MLLALFYSQILQRWKWFAHRHRLHAWDRTRTRESDVVTRAGDPPQFQRGAQHLAGSGHSSWGVWRSAVMTIKTERKVGGHGSTKLSDSCKWAFPFALHPSHQQYQSFPVYGSPVTSAARVWTMLLSKGPHWSLLLLETARALPRINQQLEHSPRVHTVKSSLF